MSYYRLYSMDPLNGHIARFVEHSYATVAEAVDWIETHKGDMALELGSQHRNVARIEAQDLGSQLIARRRQETGSEPSELTDAALAS